MANKNIPKTHKKVIQLEEQMGFRLTGLSPGGFS
jgi:hypothetical protein